MVGKTSLGLLPNKTEEEPATETKVAIKSTNLQARRIKSALLDHSFDNSKKKSEKKGLDVLDDASIDGRLHAGVLTSKVPVAGTTALAVDLGLVLGADVGRRQTGHVVGLRGARQEDDLGVGALGHGLHGLEVADLHGGCRREDIGGLAHELGALDLFPGGRAVSA